MSNVPVVSAKNPRIRNTTIPAYNDVKELQSQISNESLKVLFLFSRPLVVSLQSRDRVITRYKYGYKLLRGVRQDLKQTNEDINRNFPINQFG